MLPSIVGENLFDEWMNDSGLMNPNFFGKGHSPLYGKHASNIMKTDIRENKDSYDVIVDLRPESETYGKWLGFHLTGENTYSLLVPAGFGHGYLVVEDSVVSYKCAEVFYGEGDSGIMYNDPDIGIVWPMELIGGEENLIISEKDLNLMTFREYTEKTKRN
jgi:hypothetical protein